MSVIQKIQDKYAKAMAIVIALALIIFVVMLAFESGGSMFRNRGSSIGSVNGKSIDANDFSKKIDQQEKYMQDQGYPAGPALRQQASEGAWNQEVQAVIMNGEFKKLGLDVGKKEIGDILYGANPPEDLKRSFTDPNTGVYNGQQAKAQIDQMLKSKQVPAEQKAQFGAYIEYQEDNRKSAKYMSLLTNSVNYPKWFIEKQNADNAQLASISVVRQVYTSIPDSSVKITDKEITDYVNKHQKDFKQEESRSISYVAFSALPSATDSTDTRDRLLAMKPGFDTTQNVKLFLESQGVRTYYDGFINGSNIRIPAKDSIFRTPVGTIYGPYLDGGSYALAKMIAVRTQPDTVKVRHILISTQPTQQGAPARDTATARALADSIARAIATGSNFDTLLAKFSEDPGSLQKGGVYENITAGGMVDQFNDYIFGHPVGSKGVVKTDFGYHYIEILSQKGSSAAYKVAYLTQPIEASNATDAAANNDASLFAGSSRDQKSFDANADKLRAKGINKSFAPDLKPNDAQVGVVGINRSFVKEVFAAKLGQVLQPEKVGDSYVVAIVTEINKEGTQSAAKARLMVEPLLRNQKKAEIIQKKIGNVTSLETAAVAMGNMPIDNIDSLRMNGNQSMITGEPKVIGAAFNPANKGKVVPQAIAGVNGVYVVRVNNVSATSVADADVNTQRQMRAMQARYSMDIMGPLREASTIKDERSKVF